MKKEVKNIATTIDEFKNYVLNHDYNENMFNEDGSLNPKYNSYKKTGIIARIFEEHFDDVYQMYKDSIDLKRPNLKKL